MAGTAHKNTPAAAEESSIAFIILSRPDPVTESIPISMNKEIAIRRNVFPVVRNIRDLKGKGLTAASDPAVLSRTPAKDGQGRDEYGG
ncbi:MAG: hypothetical protein J0G94_12375 [Sphingomonadales bacterium]|nr:hypothetical protein [Sphingomonadales bacterium]